MPEFLNQPDYVAGSAGQSTSITYAANGFGTHTIPQIHISYSASPTSGSLVITSGANVRYTAPISGAGLQQVEFVPPFVGGTGEAVVVTLSGAGGAVTGYLNVWHFLK